MDFIFRHRRAVNSSLHHHHHQHQLQITRAKEISNIRDNIISTDKRTSLDLRDAYYHHSKYLLKKAAKLESIRWCIGPHKGPRNWLPMWQGSRATMFWYINWKHSPWNPEIMKAKRKRAWYCQFRKCVPHMWYCLGITWRPGSDLFWIGCAWKTCKCKPATACKHECDWWVHNRCAHIYYENSDAGQRAMSTWPKKHFFCHKHMPDVQKVGWDKELQQDVALPSNSKKFLKKVIKNKLKKWEIYNNLRNVLMYPLISWNISMTLPYLFLLWFNHPQNTYKRYSPS